MASERKQNSLKERVRGVIDQILPPSEVRIDEIKNEIWRDLSALYYKYEDENQKRAFREILHEISDKIVEGKWESIYNKLYRLGQEEKKF
ncbi:MAG: hypothetical protein ACETVY_03450 [Candidatus Bathyarchaeia archaeon]